MGYKFIFGPVSSRRFGSSLGIDLSPDQKSCNFDCLYCELKKAKAVRTIKNEPKPEVIINELKRALGEFKDIDVITLTANGEPSLYSDLSSLITQINNIKTTQKSLILSNGSAVLNPNVACSLLKLDIVKFMGEMVKHSGDAKAVVNDKSFAKRTSLNLNDIRNALNDGNDGDNYTVKKN